MIGKGIFFAAGAALVFSTPAWGAVSLPDASVSQDRLLARQVLTVRVTGKPGTTVRVSTVPSSLTQRRTLRFGPSGRRRAFLHLTGSGLRAVAGCTPRTLTVAARAKGRTKRASRPLRLSRRCDGVIGVEVLGPPTPILATPGSVPGAALPTATPAPTAGATATPSPTPAPEATSTPTAEPTPGSTPTATPTATATPSPTASPEPTPPPATGPELPGFTPVPGCDFLDPAVCLLPFPNDYFTKADASTPTGRRLDLLLSSMPRNVAGKPIDPSDWNRNDGFSPGTPIVTRIPGLDNAEAFQKTGLVPQTDMAHAFDAAQPAVLIDASTGERQLIWAELDSNPETDAERVLVIRPGKNLAEGHRFIVALRNLKNSAGATIPPQRPFQVYRDNVTTFDPVVEARRPHMEELFSKLWAAGVDRSSLYLAWDFTIASRYDRTGRARFIRDQAFAELGDTNLADLKIPANSTAPPFTVDKVTQKPNDSNTAYEVDGTFTVPCFIDTPGCAAGGRFAYTSPTATLPQRIPGSTMTAKFRCIVPESAIKPSAAPARPSLYGHGLLGSRGEVGQAQARAMTNEHNMVYCATDWSGMSVDGPEVTVGSQTIPTLGDVPSVASILVDLSNFPQLADRVQQGMLNFMYLGRLLVHPDGLAADPAFTVDGRQIIDTTRLYYDGNSQGGIIGGALMALIPDATRGVLGVPGMNYSTLLNRSTDFEATPGKACPATAEDMITLLTEQYPTNPPDDPENVLFDDLHFSYSCPLYAAYPNQLERQLLFGLMQQLWDRAEANGYALHMTSDPIENTPAHEILLHVGLGDHQVANVSAEVEARTIGAAVRPQAVDPGRSLDVEPQYAIPKITSYPFPGSAFELWDIGPLREGDQGTSVPPAANIPNRVGQDPHEFPRNTKNARAQKNAFFQPDGQIIDTCSGLPCYARGYKGAE